MNPWLTAGAAMAGAGLLAGGCAYAAMVPGSRLFGQTLIAGPDDREGTHALALTYDDGPSPRNTPPLLDLLAQHRVRATFFMIGAHVQRHPELARRVLAEGHVIGNHTVSHPNLARKSFSRVREELAGAQKILEDTLGFSPILFRPPYGARRPDVLHVARGMGLMPVMWNVTAHDWDPIGSAAIQKIVDGGLAENRNRRSASNVLLHDASHLDEFAPREDTVLVTATLLEREGLRFTTPLEWLPR